MHRGREQSRLFLPFVGVTTILAACQTGELVPRQECVLPITVPHERARYRMQDNGYKGVMANFSLEKIRDAKQVATFVTQQEDEFARVTLLDIPKGSLAGCTRFYRASHIVLRERRIEDEDLPQIIKLIDGVNKKNPRSRLPNGVVSLNLESIERQGVAKQQLVRADQQSAAYVFRDQLWESWLTLLTQPNRGPFTIVLQSQNARSEFSYSGFEGMRGIPQGKAPTLEGFDSIVRFAILYNMRSDADFEEAVQNPQSRDPRIRFLARAQHARLTTEKLARLYIHSDIRTLLTEIGQPFSQEIPLESGFFYALILDGGVTEDMSDPE